MTESWAETSEEAARRYAGELGVPDFVYDPITIPKAPKGASTREVSDGLLIVRDRGLILQSKARDPGAVPDPTRLSKWAAGAVEKATSQVKGSRRTLTTTEEPLSFKSRRGHELQVTADSSRRWPGVVLLDIPSCPPGIDAPSDDDDTLVMTLDDWYGLNETIRSTCGVIDYVHRAAKLPMPDPPLGEELSRYLFLVDSDRKLVNHEGGIPMLTAPRRLSSHEQTLLASLDEWIDVDLAGTSAPWWEMAPDDGRRAIEVLDAMPLELRLDVAQDLVDKIVEADTTGLIASGIRGMPEGRIGFLFGTDDHWSDAAALGAHAAAYAAVRHDELLALHRPGVTLVLARKAAAGEVTRTVSFIGDQPLDDIPTEIRWAIFTQHGFISPDGRVVAVSTVRRNEPCPCGSGTKFKYCHLGAQ